jgi:hypothetical protein
MLDTTAASPPNYKNYFHPSARLDRTPPLILRTRTNVHVSSPDIPPQINPLLTRCTRSLIISKTSSSDAYVCHDTTLTGMALENLVAALGLVVLLLEVEHEDNSDNADGELSSDGGPESRSVACRGVLLPERDTGNDTTDTTSADTAVSTSRNGPHQDSRFKTRT